MTDQRKSGGGKRKKPTPPEALEPRLPPSRRHPEGLPRCQRWTMRNGKFWQCARAARPAFPVCPLHGAGYESRERNGRAINPKTVRVTTGADAKPETMQLLFRNNPELQLLYEHYMSVDAHPYDFRPHLAQLRALVHHWCQTRDMGRPENINVATESIFRLARIATSVADLEQKLGPITRVELDQSYEAVSRTIARYVPPEKMEEASEYCQNLFLKITGLRRGSPFQEARTEPVPPAADQSEPPASESPRSD